MDKVNNAKRRKARASGTITVDCTLIWVAMGTWFYDPLQLPLVDAQIPSYKIHLHIAYIDDLCITRRHPPTYFRLSLGYLKYFMLFQY